MPKPGRSRCEVIAQATMSGLQVHRARAFGAEDGWRTPYIAVRVGLVLINVQDRDALACLTEAVRAANHMAEQVFGPVTPPAPGRSVPGASQVAGPARAAR